MKKIFLTILVLVGILLTFIVFLSAKRLAKVNNFKSNVSEVSSALDARKDYCGAYKNNPNNLPQDRKPRCSWVTYNNVENPDFYWIMHDLVEEGFLDKMIEGVVDEGGKAEKTYTFCELTNDHYCIRAMNDGREVVTIKK